MKTLVALAASALLLARPVDAAQGKQPSALHALLTRASAEFPGRAEDRIGRFAQQLLENFDK